MLYSREERHAGLIFRSRAGRKEWSDSERDQSSVCYCQWLGFNDGKRVVTCHRRLFLHLGRHVSRRSERLWLGRNPRNRRRAHQIPADDQRRWARIWGKLVPLLLFDDN